VFAAMMLVRVFVAVRYPLVPDETYFWEWSRHLAAGYYDHPPGIAWTIAAGVAVLGDTTLGVRAGALLCNGVAAAALIIVARDLSGAAAAFRASLVFALLPLSSALVLATPDAPLAAAVSLTLLAVLRAIDTHNTGTRSVGWWILAGLASGAGMATKLSGVLVPAGIALACAWIPAYRKQLRTPGPYVAAGLASVIMIPVLLWNAAHEWVAFHFQLDHGFGDGASGGITGALARVLEFAGGQLLVTAVVLGVAMAVAVTRAMRGKLGRRARLLAVVSVLCFAVMLVSALRSSSEPNWTAVAYPSLVLLLAVGTRRTADYVRLRRGLALAGVIVAIGYAHAFGLVPVPAAVAALDPLDRVYGWPELAHAMNARVAAERHAGSVFLAGNRYQDASELAYHSPGRPMTFSLNIGSRRNAYDHWTQFADTAQAGDHLVLVLDEPRPVSSGVIRIVADTARVLHPVVAALTPHFTEVVRDSLVSHSRGRALVMERRLWILRGWRGTWPSVQILPP
jgi:hypothetical protein